MIAYHSRCAFSFDFFYIYIRYFFLRHVLFRPFYILPLSTSIFHIFEARSIKKNEASRVVDNKNEKSSPVTFHNPTLFYPL